MMKKWIAFGFWAGSVASCATAPGGLAYAKGGRMEAPKKQGIVMPAKAPLLKPQKNGLVQPQVKK